MNERALRNWGIVGAAGALGVAALVAVQGDRAGAPPGSLQPPLAVENGAPSPVMAGPPSKTPVAPPNPGAPAAPDKAGGTGQKGAAPKTPAAEIAADIGEAINPNLEFIIRFSGDHPLARAQAQYQAGDRDGALAAARAAVANTRALRGLCFEKFTLGGSETVLAVCDRLPSTRVRTESDRWARRLRALDDVDYVDPNVILENENPVRAPR